MSKIQSELSKELTALVNYSLSLVGEAIRIANGNAIFNEVESIRQIYKNLRSASVAEKLKAHHSVSKKLSKRSSKDKFAMAHAFATSLELINICENVYRSFRLEESEDLEVTKKPMLPIIFVLTAHPTEARSSDAIKIINEIAKLLSLKLRPHGWTDKCQDQLFHLILLLIKTPISKTKSPSVIDEAEYIYSTLLKEGILKTLCESVERDQPIYIRTWVGGDKDGHPGVDGKSMLGSLSLSRKKLLASIKDSLSSCRRQLNLANDNTKGGKKLLKKILSISAHLKVLSQVAQGDGVKLKRFYKSLEHTAAAYKSHIGVASPDLEDVISLLKIFPGMVVPLELREDSALIKEALAQPNLEIIKMIKSLRSISKGVKVNWYVRGLVISMCEEAEDVANAIQMVKKHLGSLELPIVPLFETRNALKDSDILAKKIMNLPEYKKALSQYWDKKFEVMLGYSDSAKESGALFSRIMIHSTLVKLDRLIVSEGYIPIFFHGSGGSVARGGGSLRGQISWWPKSAQSRFKATIQGEMIHRSFSSVEIFNRQIGKIRSAIVKPKMESLDGESKSSILQFAERTREKYLVKVEDPEFMKMVEVVTPYPFLDQLKIGSRPSKRSSSVNLKSLRAIPWVLCWTQTRTLFPVWWGVGSTWAESSGAEKVSLSKAFLKSSLFSSFVGVLAYTLSKVDLSVWAYYLERSELSPDLKKKYYSEFDEELKLTRKFLSEVTGKEDLLWFRPWLEQSVKLRSTMIYPLNILEIEALKSKDIPLLRETVTGVASGMLTTG